jgi:hypothetical protein
VVIDGNPTGRTTPITPKQKYPLKPGKHTVTFVSKGKKFDFDVVIKPGESYKLLQKLD